MNKKELKQARAAMRLTQAKLAECLGVTRTSIARMEGGAQKIMPVTALAVRYLLLMEKTGKGKGK